MRVDARVPQALEQPHRVGPVAADVVPHLLREKVADLIDELFLEIHTETNTCCKPPHDAGRHRPDAMRLLQSLRDAGVYAHEWL